MLLSTHIRRGRSLVFLFFCGCLFQISEITLIHQGKGAPGAGATSLEKQHFGNLTEFDILTKWGLSAPIRRDNIYSTFICISNYTPSLVITKTHSE